MRLKIKGAVLIGSLVYLLSSTALASKPMPNFPYVKSGLDGFFYLKAIPKDSNGEEGSTKVFKVGKENDELVDEYNWYTKGELYMGWSPLAGKVALIRLDKEDLDLKPHGGEILRLVFYLGGNKIRSYDQKQLRNMGLILPVITFYGREGDVKVLGVQQIPGTNEYVLSFEKENGEIISFDIVTGEQKKR